MSSGKYMCHVPSHQGIQRFAAERTYVFRMILTINTDDFRKQI